MIKKVLHTESIPVFYAPYKYCHKTGSSVCTIFPFNIIFYLILEGYYILNRLVYATSARYHNGRYKNN